ncbi:glycosyltransferase [Desulfatirhabdium butyrativorans]|uniref:glycosyltransferase n=1 Tax=Desulfatirhabdium butyrativorans TaxID=340467 RepID=UPI0003FAAAE4|nr:glycosyltransferase [Desulfatirhabdium butyrativorans]
MAVLIAVVTCNGEATIGRTLKAALALDADAPVLVIDNASMDATIAVVGGMENPRIRLNRNDENLGVGAAFNEALRHAKTMGAEWLMLLDQDSEPAADALAVMREAALDPGDAGSRTSMRVAALFPTVRCRSHPDVIHYPMDWTGAGFSAVIPEEGQDVPGRLPVDTAISSGALYRVAALDAIGGFNEGYFIDFVDHECHLRLKNAGFGLWWVRGAEIRHDLGRIQKRTDSGLWIEHAPFRYYYMARNMIRGYWHFGGMRALWGLIGEMRGHIRRLRENSADAEACIAALRLGVVHGILGKTGKHPSCMRL